MDFCPNFQRVAWSHEAGGLCLLTRLRCKMWSCEYCARKNQSMWRAFLMRRLPEVSSNWWLMTLTASPKYRLEETSYKNLQSGIDRLFKRIRRVYPEIDYVRTFEKHPTSVALHAHFIVAGLAPFLKVRHAKNGQRFFRPVEKRGAGRGYWTVLSWIKVAAWEVGLGYQADVRKVSVNQASWYVTKYLTKELQGITIKGLRHVQTSRGLGSPESKTDNSWQTGRIFYQTELLPAENLKDIQLGQEVSSDYWSTANTYPPE